MVLAMGGPVSEGYRRFRNLACQAYTILRKSAGLILNLIALMLDSGIGEPETIGPQDIEKVGPLRPAPRPPPCSGPLPVPPARS